MSRLRAIRRTQLARGLERHRAYHRAYWAYRASLPHDPMWNLIPRKRGVPFTCSWHGTVEVDSCGECVREHAEYMETGAWEDRRGATEDERRAAGEPTALTEELGLYDVPPTACIAHLRMVPCRKDGPHVFSSEPGDVARAAAFGAARGGGKA